MDGLQIHILHANYALVHKQAPIKMAAGAVSMVFHLGRGFGKSLFITQRPWLWRLSEGY